LGDRLLGRTIEVRLLEAVLVDEIELDGWRGTTSGIWFVAQLDAAAVLERASLIAELEIDGVTYAATERTDDVVTDRLLRVMLPIRGNMAIEMPTEVLQTAAAERAILRFKERGDVRLDSVIEFAIDLTSLERG